MLKRFRKAFKSKSSKKKPLPEKKEKPKPPPKPLLDTTPQKILTAEGWRRMMSNKSKNR